MVRQSATLAATNAVICTAGGALIRINGLWSGAGAVYLQLFDALALPADDTAPGYVIAVAATSNYDIDLSHAPFEFKTGLVACFSSTMATKTIVTGEGNTGTFLAKFSTQEPAGLTLATSTTPAADVYVIANEDVFDYLYRVRVTSGAAHDGFLQIYVLDADTPGADDVPILEANFNEAAIDLCFGADMLKVVNATSTYFFVGKSSTRHTYTAMDEGDLTFRVWYDAL